MVSNGYCNTIFMSTGVSWLNVSEILFFLLCDYGSGSTLMWRIYEKENIDVDMYTFTRGAQA